MKRAIYTILVLVTSLLANPAHAVDRQITCESIGYQLARCDTGLQATNVIKFQQLSGAACVQGSSWSYDSRYITVMNGCRAIFQASGTALPTTPNPTPTPDPTPTPVPGPTTTAVQRQVTCESLGYLAAKCDTGLQTTTVTKYQQLSGAPCTQGSSWSHDSRYIMVNNGCRAIFRVSGSVVGGPTPSPGPTSPGPTGPGPTPTPGCI